MIRSTLAVGAVACALLASADVGNAQRARRFPGAPGSDGMSAAANRAEYYADVMLHTNALLGKWRGAWAADDIETLLELYTEDATFIFNQDDPVRGREAIHEKLESLLQRSGEVQASFTDFDASGRMGLITGLLTFQLGDQRGSRVLTGIHMTVLIRNGRDWGIRSQLIRLDQPENATPSN
ncbi:MAG: nuclear transport factor 2 family protein [Gemmatimonadota bacterium]|nr:nuclear transport factor 2 family protein [Gemmatimonadota bacterium]MDE2866012.1 nuclear transport factor 2 family protein [Gemmatimonadota bacterium]MXV95688.1 nuclear transport factor 2 family protein [Gemmatimonadota bacterium]MYB07252.1 nuclear transport factor 2 family protein [Gemmatimonadota bacterium]MYE16915.1 nuclear transport factor 2 family protein [Gemmatimonadota bacterium]